MLLRVFSDVHGNLPALIAVLDDSSGMKADKTICLGDTVGYGANPVECAYIVRDICDEVIAGNHDLGAAALISISHFNHDGQKAIEWTRKQFEQDYVDWINTLPLQLNCHGIKMSHASVVNPSSWIYIHNSATAIDAILATGECLSIYGHTHIPMQWNRMGRCSDKPAGLFSDYSLINCGSVGQPRDGDPRAAYLLVNTEERTFRHVRVKYDVEAAASSINEAGLPGNLAGRLYLGK